MKDRRAIIRLFSRPLFRVHVLRERLLAVPMALAALFFALLPASMLAQQPPLPPCDNLPGCGRAYGAGLLENAAFIVLQVLFTLVGGGAVAAIVWGGFQMVLASGDESKAEKGKQNVINAIIGLGVAGAAGSIVTTVIGYTPGGTFDPVDLLAYAVTILLRLFDAAIIIVVIIAGIRMAASAGKSDQFQKGVATIKWALIGAVVAHLSTALAQLVAQMIL